MATQTSAAYAPYTLVLLRVVVGILFVLHGLPKWTSLAGTAQFFGSLGIPWPGVMAPWVAFLETVGGAALILGALTRYVGVLFAFEMLVATVAFKLPRLGLVAPMGQPGVGAELDLLLLAGSLVLAAFGPGPFSVDGALRRSPA